MNFDYDIMCPALMPSFPSIYVLHLSIIFVNIFKIFSKKLPKISHNVPAVYDVLPARIGALRSKDQGWQNVGGVRRGNGA